MKLHIFTDNKGLWSWRKAITGIIALIILVSMLGYEIFNWRVLAGEYIGIIITVVTWYFFRRRIDGKKADTDDR